MTKNVTVTDESGTYVGTTYPKRAKGLVKNGRALFVDDCTIRLSAKTESSDNKSEVKQMNYIYFNPREWSLAAQAGHTERSFINDFDGNLVESIVLGGWNTNYVKMLSKHILLAPDTDYCFVFWLNGGENDKGSEICQLQIIFFQNQDDCYIYKLNRNYIKPLLHKQGWELYSIPFHTPGIPDSLSAAVPGTSVAVDAQFAFVSGFAPMAVKPAKEPDFYKDWEDAPDEFASWRPQRHNIVFEDGWPSRYMYGGNQYSTEILRARRDAEAAADKARKSGRIPGCLNIRDTHAYTEHGSHSTGTADRAANMPDADELSERIGECADLLQDARERYGEIEDRFREAQARYGELFHLSRVTTEARAFGDGRFDAMTAELSQISGWLADLERLTDDALNGDIQRLSSGRLDSLENRLDALEGRYDAMEDSLDSLEDFLEELEDEDDEDEEN